MITNGTQALNFIFSVAVKNAVVGVLNHRASVAKVKPVVEGYQTAIMNQYNFKPERSELNIAMDVDFDTPVSANNIDLLSAAEADVLYTAFDNARNAFFPQCKNEQLGFCPLLSAEHKLYIAERALIVTIEREALKGEVSDLSKIILGCNFSRVHVREVHKAAVELIVSLVLAYCLDVQREVKEAE